MPTFNDELNLEIDFFIVEYFNYRFWRIKPLFVRGRFF